MGEAGHIDRAAAFRVAGIARGDDGGQIGDAAAGNQRAAGFGRIADDASERLLQILQQEGRVMLSGTRIDGRFFIRCAILSFRSHAEHVDDAIDAIARAAEAVKNG